MDESLYKVDEEGSASAGGCKLAAEYTVSWRLLFRTVKLASNLINNCENLCVVQEMEIQHKGPNTTYTTMCI